MTKPSVARAPVAVRFDAFGLIEDFELGLSITDYTDGTITLGKGAIDPTGTTCAYTSGNSKTPHDPPSFFTRRDASTAPCTLSTDE